MYLVMQEAEEQPYKGCSRKRWEAEKQYARVSEEEELGKIVKERWGQKKGEEKFCWGEGGAQHAWAALWDQLTKISATSAEANQHPSPEWPVTVVMYREPISPYIFSWILALLPVSGRERESEWMKERDRKVRLRACCWTVGEKSKEKEKKKDVDKKENET